MLALQVVFANRIVANGKHASDHLQSAQVVFPVAFFLAVIFWAAREARRHADAWIAGAMVGLAFSAVALGNLRVIWSIGGDSWTDEQAGALGSARPGFDSGHSLVETGTTAGVAAMVLFIVVLRTHRIVRTGPAIAAAALSLLPLIAPGIGPLGFLGIVVLVADVFNIFNRQTATDVDNWVETTFGSPNPDYGTAGASSVVAGQQFLAPRQLRVGARLEF